MSENLAWVNVILLAHIGYDADVSQMDHKGCMSHQCFVSESFTSTEEPAKLASSTKEPDRESVRVMVMGSRQGVLHVIHTLHVLGFAEVGAWSPLLPAPRAGEVMSILTLNFVVE